MRSVEGKLSIEKDVELGGERQVENWRRRVAKDGNIRTVKRAAGPAPEPVSREKEPIKATVKTAQPLTQQMMDVLSEHLQTYARRPVELVNVVDPGVVAGMVVQLGSRMVDMSLQAQLAELENRIERALSESVRTLSNWDVSVEELIKRAKAKG